MLAPLRQASFASGEIAPALHARADLALFAAGAARIENWRVLREGGASYRPGLQYVRDVKDSAAARLIPFRFSHEAGQSYALEFTQGYIRFHTLGGTVESTPGFPYEVTTPYTTEELDQITYTQINDVLVLCHPNHAPRELRRYGHAQWTLTEIDFGVGPARPVILGRTAEAEDETHWNQRHQWVATAVDADGRESLPSLPFPTDPEATQTTLYSDRHVKVNIQPQDGVAFFNVFRGSNGIFEYVGSVSPDMKVTSPGGDYVPFTDKADVPNAASQPPTRRNPYKQGVWTATTEYGLENRVTSDGNTYECIVAGKSGSTPPSGTGTEIKDGTVTWRYVQTGTATPRFPAAVTHYSGRRSFGGGTVEPSTLRITPLNQFASFEAGDDPLPDQALTILLAAHRLADVRHLVGVKALLVMTGSSEWAVSGTQGAAIATDDYQAVAQSYHGCSYVPPVLVGNALLFVTARKASIRELAYTYEADGYAGDDLTILARHLFSGYQIVDLTFASEPNAELYAVRSDGMGMGCTYVKEQALRAWWRIVTDGALERMLAVPEEDEDVVYCVVRRTVDGATKRTIERFAPKAFSRVRDGVFLDSAVTYDGRTFPSGATLTLSAASWTPGSDVTATCSAGLFQASDVGCWLVVDPDGTAPTRLEVIGYTSPTTLACRALTSVPVGQRSTALSLWAKAAARVTVAHLEGKTVSALCDGNVASGLTVAAGIVTLPEPAVVAHIGLPYVGEIETLAVTDAQGDVRYRQKTTGRVWVEYAETRGLSVAKGEDRVFRPLRLPADGALHTGAEEVLTDSGWSNRCRVIVRQDAPLPATVLAITPEVVLAER